MKTLIRNANVWQKGKFLTKDVLVDGERIAVVGKLPEETQCDHEVDGTGKFLLPGVIDCHAHSTMVCGTRHMPDFFASSDAELTLDGAINAEKMVRCGITTIRDCGGRRFETLAVRDYINKGKLIGPRMLCSGTPLKVVGGHEPGADYTGPWEARARVREFLMHGVDFLKVMVTGGLGKAGEDPGCVEPTQEELDAIVSEAKKHGKKVACHCHSRQGMEMLVKAGADSVEHSTYLDADVDKLLIENGVYVVPTFLPYMNYALLGEQEHQLMDTVLAARAIVDEKLYMEDAGMTPGQIIHAATEESAKLCGVFGETGSIDEGKAAGMILLSASPLEDLRAFNTALLGVYMRGRYLGKREEAV